MSDDTLKVDFGDGVSALSRTMKTITMMADGVIAQVMSMGWSRDSIQIVIDANDPLPCWVSLHGKRLFEIDATTQKNGMIHVKGEWISDIPKRSFIDRLLGR